MPKGVVWPWWRRAAVVLAKEMRDHSRDRRSLCLALIYPLLGPLVVGLLMEVATNAASGSGPRAVAVAVRGADRAPDLMAFLTRNQVALVPPIEAEALAQGLHDPVTLEIPAGAGAGGPFTVRLLFDAGNAGATSTAGLVADLVNRYGRSLGQRWLAAHGIDPGLVQPVTVERVATGHRHNLAGLLYNLVPPLTVFMIFLGAVYLALDTTIGERERGTLEPLLTAPLRRWELLLGKAAAAFLFTVATVVVNLTAFRLVLGWLAADLPGIEAPPGTVTFLLMFVMALPVMVLAVTLQLAVAALARTLKEAQIYLGLLPLVPALPGIASALTPTAPHLWTWCVPVYGQMVMFGRLMAGIPAEPLAAGLSAMVTLAIAAMIFCWATRLYQQDRNLTAD